MQYSIDTSTALIVDDEPSVARVVAKLLSRRGYSCRMAHDASAAEKILKEEAFDLVVSDLRMPGQCGIDFLSEVVKLHPETATVILTGYADTATENLALQVGVDAFMSKNVDQNEIERCLESALINKTIRLAAAVA